MLFNLFALSFPFQVMTSFRWSHLDDLHTLVSYSAKLYYVRSTQAYYRGADKSLARPGRKSATATEYFDIHISYF